MKFTIIQSKSNISKKFSLDENGELSKEDGGNLHVGNFRTANMSISELGEFIQNCNHKQIIAQGVTGHEMGLITTKSSLSKYESAEHATVSRSKEFFHYEEGQEGFLLLDYDPNEYYKEGKSLSKEEFLQLVYTAIPEIKDCPHLWKTSSSSNIIQINKETDKFIKKSGINGQHVIIAISDMSLIPDFFDYLYNKLWCIGEGYVFVDKVGRIHDRTIVDKVVNSPEREIFLRACLIDETLRQDLSVEVFNPKKKALNLASVLESVDVNATREEYEGLYKKEYNKYAKESKKRLNDYIKKNAKKHDLSEESLKLSIVERKLFSDFKIKLNNGVYVSVEDILEKPSEYSGMYCFEPFEPEYGGYCGTKAWIDAYNERVYSHAHGGIEYELVDFRKKTPEQLAHVLLGIDNEKKRYKLAAELVEKYKYEQTEIDSLLSKIHDSTGQKLKSIKDTFQKYRKKGSGNYSDNTDSDVQLNFNACVDIEIDQYDQPLNAPFPHVDIKGKIASTSANLKFMLTRYKIEYSYNPITKIGELNFPLDIAERTNLTDEANYLKIESMCVINGMTKNTVEYLPALMNEKVVNPVYDWIKEEEWDGIDRIEELTARIKTNFHIFEDESSNDVFTKKYMKKIIRMWLVECMAALDGAKNTPIRNAIPSFEYVLVFVGNQGAGKTKFLSSLLPFDFRSYIVTGHELDTKSKDSIKKAVSCWICELGELDSTFKKSEISSLKAFLSDETDILRLPYAKTEMRMKRNTAFCGSVNGYDFLRDKTGNRRYLPVSVNGLVPLYEPFEFEKEVSIKEVDGTKERLVGSEMVKCGAMDTQQLWAQVYGMYIKGAEWWPDAELEKMLVRVTDGHSQTSFVSESLEEFIHVNRNEEWRKKNKIVSDNKKYVEICRDRVKENLKTGEGYEDGSLDESGKSVALFHRMNVKELFHNMGLEHNRQNMRELNEEMAKLGFLYGKKSLDGDKKMCYWVCVRERDNLHLVSVNGNEIR